MKSPVFLICCTFFLSSCGSGHFVLKNGDRIFFFGDSITELGVKPGGYVTLIKDSLARKFPEKTIEVVGAGVSGNKVTDLLARVDRDVLARKPSLVVIYIGVNDVWHFALNGKGTPKDVYEAGLRELIGKISVAGSKVILCTPSVIGEKYDGTNPQDPMLEEYAAVSRKVSAETSVPLCDLRRVFLGYLKENNPENKERDILTYDKVHLNNAGNVLVAVEILKILTGDTYQ